MRAGVVVSTSFHVALLALLIFRLPQAEPYEVEENQAFDVEIVPFADVPTTRLGTRDADLRELASVIETETQEQDEGLFQGNAARDLNEAPTENPTNVDVQEQQAASAETNPEVRDAPATQPTPPLAERAPLPEPVPASAQPAPESDTPEKNGPQSSESNNAETQDSNETASAAPSPPPAAPRPRPRAIELAAAAALERQRAEQEAAREAERQTEAAPDAIGQVINRQEVSGGGTRSSEQQASLGAETGQTSVTLTQSEEDNLRRQIEPCWSPPVGIADGDQLRVSMRFGLNLDGSVAQNPQVVNSGNSASFPGNASAFRAAASAAQRAILRCAPYQMPPEKYEAWRDVIVNFDPRDLF